MLKKSAVVSLLLGVLAVTSDGSTGEIHLICSYSDKGVATEFNEKGEPSMEPAKFGGDTISLRFDLDTGEAELGATSTADLTIIESRKGSMVNLIERTGSGLSIFTVYFLKSGRHPFVQSRHFDFLGPFPQQYYGTCVSAD